MESSQPEWIGSLGVYRAMETQSAEASRGRLSLSLFVCGCTRSPARYGSIPLRLHMQPLEDQHATSVGSLPVHTHKKTAVTSTEGEMGNPHARIAQGAAEKLPARHSMCRPPGPGRADAGR